MSYGERKQDMSGSDLKFGSGLLKYAYDEQKRFDYLDQALVPRTQLTLQYIGSQQHGVTDKQLESYLGGLRKDEPYAIRRALLDSGVVEIAETGNFVISDFGHRYLRRRHGLRG